ncbi:unnamed protein product, partial [Ixodes hexagonus]
RPSGTCAVWGRGHYRTFDGSLFSFRSRCRHLLAHECRGDTFSVHVSDRHCDASTKAAHCRRSVQVYVEGQKYDFEVEPAPRVWLGNVSALLPTTLEGLRVDYVAGRVIINSQLGFTVVWDGRDLVEVSVEESLKGSMCGLCGQYDGDPANDFVNSHGRQVTSRSAFLDSWKKDDLGGMCRLLCDIFFDPSIQHHSEELLLEARRLCSRVTDEVFASCHKLVDPKPYSNMCLEDYVSCLDDQGESCRCSALAEYFRECTRLGGRLEATWRRDDLCPAKCPAGKVYSQCGASCVKTCRDPEATCQSERCVDGCHCPEKTLLHNGLCLRPQQCPCLLHGREYRAGSLVKRECNSCECRGGEWQCTLNQCPSRCVANGDPFYSTFDGKTYEFSGQCPYYLLRSKNFSVIQELGHCPTDAAAAAVKESEGAAKNCYKSVTVASGKDVVIIEREKVTVNSYQVQLPYSGPEVIVYSASSEIMRAQFPNGVVLLWDRNSRLHIDSPPSLQGQFQGMCGTNNLNQKDDFWTPTGDVEVEVRAFAQKWKVDDSCVEVEALEKHPCERAPQRASGAKRLCNELYADFFQECHYLVDPEPYYKMCLHRTCACDKALKDCICPSFADYAAECTRKGRVTQWRQHIPPCGVDCPQDTAWSECVREKSCFEIALGESGNQTCVEGCACVSGYKEDGSCVAIDDCSCLHDHRLHAAGSMKKIDGQMCECDNGEWECSDEDGDHDSAPPSFDVDGAASERCAHDENAEYTSCLDGCPRTCDNMSTGTTCDAAGCTAGCRCKTGFVLEKATNSCIPESQCGCKHGGKTHPVGTEIRRDCNKCTCVGGHWVCEKGRCPGVCTVWGESHFSTFDGHIFDFRGDCEFMLAKGRLDKDTHFEVSFQSVPCAAGDTVCKRTTRIVLRGEEVMTLGGAKQLPAVRFGAGHIIRETTLQVTVFTNMGVVIQWDKATRISIIIQPSWKGRVKGLCGNFDGNQMDDFQTPSGGMVEGDARVFGDSWKIREMCPATKEPEDVCEQNPHRKIWAVQKCEVLKSPLFEPCHSEVSLEPYYERCVQDVCGCDSGGDCECLCTNIAAYAHECGAQDVPIKWRSQTLCPIQCDSECSEYDACMPGCPPYTCETLSVSGRLDELCGNGTTCQEGCRPKPCPPGYVFDNERDMNCVREAHCKVPCKEIFGKLYLEGERIIDDRIAEPCESCFCQGGSIVCKGHPCPNTEPPPTVECSSSGWTPWLNPPTKASGVFALLRDLKFASLYSGYCGPQNVVDIECRVASSGVDAINAGQSVTCELPRGLACYHRDQAGSSCLDYEVRLLCGCGDCYSILPENMPPSKYNEVTPRGGLSTQTSQTGPLSESVIKSGPDMPCFARFRQRSAFLREENLRTLRTSLGLVGGGSPRATTAGVTSPVNDMTTAVDDGDRQHSPTGGPWTTCLPEWSIYYSSDSPDAGDGDVEILEDIRKKYNVCLGRPIGQIECKARVGGKLVDYRESGDVGVKCSNVTGLVCLNWLQPRGKVCKDYAVRFLCLCGDDGISPPLTPTPPILSPTTPLSSPTPLQPLPRFPTSIPLPSTPCPPLVAVGDGVTPYMSVFYLGRSCSWRNVQKIECKAVNNETGTLIDWTETDDSYVTCSPEKGLVCLNDYQESGKDCHNYKIRVFCVCQPKVTWELKVTPEPTVTPDQACPPGQVYSGCAHPCNQTCSSFLRQLNRKRKCLEEDGCLPGCRPASGCERPKFWHDYATCVEEEDCSCMHGGQVIPANQVVEEDCQSCICQRNKVVCSDLPDCDALTTGLPLPSTPGQGKCSCQRANRNSRLLEKKKTEKRSGCLLAIPKRRSKCVAFIGPLVQKQHRWKEKQGKKRKLGQQIIVVTRSAVSIWSVESRSFYPLQVLLLCDGSTLAPLPSSSQNVTLPVSCVPGWTPWYNVRKPDEHGDFETVDAIRGQGHFVCDEPYRTDVQCRAALEVTRAVKSPVPRQNVVCDLRQGLLCSNEAQRHRHKCLDHAVRFYCDCSLSRVTSTTPLSTGKIFECVRAKLKRLVNSKSCEGRGDLVDCRAEQHTLTRAHTPTKPCSEPATHTPKGLLQADQAHRRNLDRGSNHPAEDMVVADQPHRRSLVRGSTNHTARGFLILFFLQCRSWAGEIVSKLVPVALARPTKKPRTVHKCKRFVYLVNGPMPLPASSYKASSSASPASDPNHSRLGTTTTQTSLGAWIPRRQGVGEFVEVDLGRVRTVFGVTTQGRDRTHQWVTRYRVLVSADGVQYAYLQDADGQVKDFLGNHDSSGVMRQLFESPVRARFVRIEPVTWSELIALRFDVLGCVDGDNSFAHFNADRYANRSFQGWFIILIPVDRVPYSAVGTLPTAEYVVVGNVQQLRSAQNRQSSIGSSILWRNSTQLLTSSRVRSLSNFSTSQVRKFENSLTSLFRLSSMNFKCTGTRATLLFVLGANSDKSIRCSFRDTERRTGDCPPASHPIRSNCTRYTLVVCCPRVPTEAFYGAQTATSVVSMCPEIPEQLRQFCPSCPQGYLCDGSSCVPETHCPCFQDGHLFHASYCSVNTIVKTRDCNTCTCSLNGRSKCTRTKCRCVPQRHPPAISPCPMARKPSCPKGQYAKMDRHARCPEYVCGMSVAYAYCCSSRRSGRTSGTCMIAGNTVKTFDGQEFRYEICDHVLLQDKKSKQFSVTAHKRCHKRGDIPVCEKSVSIMSNDVFVKLGPTLQEVMVNGADVPTRSLQTISRRLQDVHLALSGQRLVFVSHKHNFQVALDELQNIKIGVSECLSDTTSGLCGSYNENQQDDFRTPDNRLESSAQAFGDSWATTAKASCSPSTCPQDVRERARQWCHKLKEAPLSQCLEASPSRMSISICEDFVCECMAFSEDDAKKCMCQAIEGFVSTCAATIRQKIASEWRLQLGCAPKCPAGMEWRECGPACEKTCENMRDKSNDCSEDCIAGCFCPMGLVRRGDACVPPEFCHDCVCRGHGDPNYITFDGRYYDFQGTCSYILAQHVSGVPQLDFQVMGTNVECPEEPRTTCTQGLAISYRNHHVRITKGQRVKFNDYELQDKDYPWEKKGFNISWVPGRSTVVYVPEISLVVRFFELNYGFSIELPSFTYFNKTEGLCGVCNFDESDDLLHRNGRTSTDIPSFAYSWLVEGTPEICRVQAPASKRTVPDDICKFQRNACDLYVDPDLYQKSCLNDAGYSRNLSASICRSKLQYAEHCCSQGGVSVHRWLQDSGCDSGCPRNMELRCDSGCPKTCANYRKTTELCPLAPSYSCFCKDGFVLKNGECVAIKNCEACDDEGHLIGDTWQVSPCETCECGENLKVRCTSVLCPAPPTCRNDEKLIHLPRNNATCCDAYLCDANALYSCKPPPPIACQPGAVSKLKTNDEGCPSYFCECDLRQCPSLQWPANLEQGLEAFVELQGCCNKVSVRCNPQRCQDMPNCPPDTELQNEPGECCTTYKCVPKNKCAYIHKYKVVNGMQMKLHPAQQYQKMYPPESSWSDGLCTNCSCSQRFNQYQYSCRVEVCPSEQQDTEDYEYTVDTRVSGVCCPKQRRTACKGGGLVYNIGSRWTLPGEEKCRSYRCEQSPTTGEAVKAVLTQICNETCLRSEKYVSPRPGSNDCCGRCVREFCEENHNLYHVGERWTSTLRPCFSVECTRGVSGAVEMKYTLKTCPQLPSNCPKNNIVRDDTGCCQKCQITPGSCAPHTLGASDSLQYFTLYDKSRGGFCSNSESIQDLTECKGQCYSSTIFSPDTNNFVSSCRCCTMTKAVQKTVTLTCTDGSKIQKQYQNPTECGCTTCGVQAKSSSGIIHTPTPL